MATSLSNGQIPMLSLTLLCLKSWTIDNIDTINTNEGMQCKGGKNNFSCNFGKESAWEQLHNAQFSKNLKTFDTSIYSWSQEIKSLKTLTMN